MRSFGLAGISPKFFMGNQLSIARSRIAPLAAFLAGGPNANGPVIGAAGWPYGTSCDFGGYFDGDTNGGVTALGSINGANPATATINGARISALSWTDAPAGFVVVLAGALAQNYFNTITLGAPINLTFATAAANFFDSGVSFPGFTIWGFTHAAVNILGDTVTYKTA